MLTIDEALALVARHAKPLAPRRIPLEQAAGLVIAEDVVSQWNSPPYSKSMMDGYAVISSDREPVRVVVEEVAAGAVPHRAVVPGTATRIMTGAPIPEGADAVIPIENTSLVDDSRVRIAESETKAAQHVLPMGAAIRVGDTVIRRGAVLRPIEIAILAEIGHGMISAFPRAAVAVLPTGNELVAAGQFPANGQIRNSNGPMLISAVGRAGAQPVDLGIGRDDHDDLRRRIEQGFEADVLLLSGGVSVGTFDLAPQVLAELEVVEVFHKIALRPGKPLWFGVKQRGERQTLVFGLPGNPVSSFVCFELFVRPALSVLTGRGFENPSAVTARLTHEYDHPGGRAACLPALVTIGAEKRTSDRIAPQEQLARFAALEGAAVEILRWQGSADIAALAKANALVRLPAHAVRLAPETPLEVLLI